MKIPFRLTRVGLAAMRFHRQRAEWYEYIGDMTVASEGRQTIKGILDRDARRYGSHTARGILSEFWLQRLSVTGDLGQALAGTLPFKEVVQIQALQRMGQVVLADGLLDLSRVAHLKDNLTRTIVMTTFMGGIAVFMLWLMVALVVPYVTGPELEQAYGSVAPELFGPLSIRLFSFSESMRANGLYVWSGALAVLALTILSFPRYDGPGRRFLDKLGPYRLYRDVQAIAVITSAATALKSRGGKSIPLRHALQAQKAGASTWLANRVDRMLSRVEDSKAGAAIFDVGLLDLETYGYLDDLTCSHGLDVALQKTSSRMERRILPRVQLRASVLRWALLLVSISALIGIVLYHYAVISEIRRAMLLVT